MEISSNLVLKPLGTKLYRTVTACISRVRTCSKNGFKTSFVAHSSLNLFKIYFCFDLYATYSRITVHHLSHSLCMITVQRSLSNLDLFFNKMAYYIKKEHTLNIKAFFVVCCVIENHKWSIREELSQTVISCNLLQMLRPHTALHKAKCFVWSLLFSVSSKSTAFLLLLITFL